MRHYLDLHLLPDPELPPHVLMAAMFTNLHRALADMKSEHIGIAFPGYRKAPAQLGSQMRLVGPIEALAHLLARPWLGALRDHVGVSSINEVPSDAEHRSLRRIQAKSSPARLRRRQMKRHGLSEVEAFALMPDSAAEHLQLPFVQVHSASTGQTFRVFLDLSEPQVPVTLGSFNSYGLSHDRTLPWF